MTALEKTQEEIFNSEILIVNASLDNFKAVSLKKNNAVIIYDKKQMEDSKEENTILNHELFHCKYDKFYNFDTSLQARKYRETRVHRKMIESILPLEKIMSFIISEIPSWEIAEELCMTEQFVLDAFNYYKEKGVIKSANLQD